MDRFDNPSDFNVPTSLSDPIINDHNPISADCVDIYHPDAWLCLYPLTGDCLWTGDLRTGHYEFESEIFFGGKYTVIDYS
jgi:hypothetical protein